LDDDLWENKRAMAITRRQVLGDVVTAYEVYPNDPEHCNQEQGFAQPDEETTRSLFERMMQESERLAKEIQLEGKP